MNTDSFENDGEELEREMIQFLEEQKLYEGPDPNLVNDHHMEPRSNRQQEALDRLQDDEVTRMVIKNRLQYIVNEAQEMDSHIAYAPGAKWGDLITGLFTREGDVAFGATGGILIFLPLMAPPIKHLMKRRREDDNFEINEGDIFTHNDTRFGMVHNTDFSTILPIFQDDELIAWAGTIIHEGENGATEPGGMPADAESPYDEGLKLQPIKIGTNYQADDDWLNFIQNSVRDKKLMKNDHRARLAATKRVVDRVKSLVEEYNTEALVGTMRHVLESTTDKVRNRIRTIPDGTYRHQLFLDTTLKENVLIKLPCEMKVESDKITVDIEGVAPQFSDRSINSVLPSLKGMMVTTILYHIWPDLPRNQSVMEPISVNAPRGTVLNCTSEVPNAQCQQTFLVYHTALDAALQKALYGDFIQSNRSQTTDLHANRWNSINGWCYGGITQHGDFVGNLFGDLNCAPGGGRWNRDGLDTQAGTFCAMGDLGEMEQYEEEFPVVGITRTRLMKNLQGFGKYRGGHGHQQVVTHKESPYWGWLNFAPNSRFPMVGGLFGGYSSPTVPCGWVKESDIFQELRENPEQITYDISTLMREKPYEGDYGTWRLCLPDEEAQEGEIYWMSQGAGGGFGDPLTRDPERVLEDFREDRINDWVVENIYFVSIDKKTGTIDPDRTRALREKKREKRLDEALPYDQFLDEWESSEPPEDVPYFGSWNDPQTLYAGHADRAMHPDEIQPVSMNKLRTEHPELFDTPQYPRKPQWVGELHKEDSTPESND